jgi:hypothetical protein
MFLLNVAKKVLLVLEIWSVGWYGLWPKINLLKKSFVGGSLSAATMNEGTQLFKLEDARLFEWVNKQ